MPEEHKEIVAVFKKFVESGLVDHDVDALLSVISEDIIGIGMGSQGFVESKEDIARIMGEEIDSPATVVAIEYEKIVTRCYEERYGLACGVFKIKSVTPEKNITSTLGQILSLRKEGEKWMICALQATPIFDQIDELEAYPIKFAQTLLETYRQQEQIAKGAYSDSAAIYLVDFTQGVFQNCILKSDVVVRTEKGEPYEKVMFDAARSHIAQEDTRYHFIRTFSLGNVLRAFQAGETELSLEYQMVVSPGNTLWMKTILKLYFDNARQRLMGYLYVMDIDKEKRRELELQSKAELDSLTGLYNKHASETKIAEKLGQLSPGQGAFFMLDLDYFKAINDTYGHQEGDRIIQGAALCIQDLLDKDDLAGRLGGDEFCVFFHDAYTQESLAPKADLLCHKIRQLLPGGSVGTSCSIGAVLCRQPNLTFETIYRQADQALYLQKRKGRNGFTFYSGSTPL